MAETKSTLSSVVSSLMRASMGTSVPNAVADDDLDRHIAELILKEAKQKADKYGKDGIRAYLPQYNWSESNAPKTNKRFLSSIIRSTDEHNKTILRAQAEAVEELRQDKREQERRERIARAEEAAEAERLRRLMGVSGSAEWAHNWERGNDKRRGKRRENGREEWEDKHSSPSREIQTRSSRSERRHRRRSRSRSAEHRSHRGEGRSSKRVKTEGRTSRHFSRSPESCAHEPRRRRGSTYEMEVQSEPDPKVELFSGHRKRTHTANLKQRSQTPDYHPTTSRSIPREHSTGPFPPPERDQRKNRKDAPRSPSVTPPPLPCPSSKMDKYFEASYDPRLDVAPLAVPKVPKTGLIDDDDFAGWDAMLELIRLRREDKAEKKRDERLGLKSSKKSGPDKTAGWETNAGSDIMDIEYKKRGSVREWDLGKQDL